VWQENTYVTALVMVDHVQLSRPQMVNIPDHYAPLASEDDEQNLSAEERRRRREMSERYRRMVAAQRCISLGPFFIEN